MLLLQPQTRSRAFCPCRREWANVKWAKNSTLTRRCFEGWMKWPRPWHSSILNPKKKVTYQKWYFSGYRVYKVHHEVALVYSRRLFVAISFQPPTSCPCMFWPRWVLHSSMQHTYPGGLVKLRLLDPTLRSFRVTQSGIGLTSLHSNKFTGGDDACGLWTTLGKPPVNSCFYKMPLFLQSPGKLTPHPRGYLIQAFANSFSQKRLFCVLSPSIHSFHLLL